MFTDSFNSLSAALPEKTVLFDAPLKNLTTMKVGGNATCLVEATDESVIRTVINFTKQENIPLLVIGNGSNMVISDLGFPGVVLHISKGMAHIHCDGTRIIAQAGALLPAVSRLAADNSLTGLEFASGIPGSVGGAVVMNAGAYGGEMSHVLESVTILADAEVKTIPVDELALSYRHSIFMDHPDWIILSASFKLQKGDQAQIIAQMNDLNARRREKQPLQYPSSGSFFKRPEGHFAGALIEQSGLKGFSIGGAQVSALHAGFVINTGNATASDVYQLMLHVQKTVMERFHVSLLPEVRLIGQFEV